MATRPTFHIRRRRDGTVWLLRSDGEPFTWSDTEWLKETLTKELRKQGFVDKFKELDPKDMGKYKVDPLIHEFEAEARRQSLPRRVIAKALFLSNESRLGTYASGKQRPYMDLLRMWGYVLGLTVLSVPHPLEKKVRAMVAEWFEANPPAEVVTVEEEEE